VAPPDDLIVDHQDRADGDAALGEAGPGLVDCRLHEGIGDRLAAHVTQPTRMRAIVRPVVGPLVVGRAPIGCSPEARHSVMGSKSPDRDEGFLPPQARGTFELYKKT